MPPKTSDTLRMRSCGFSEGMPALARSSSLRRFFSASVAIVFRLVLADSRMRLPSKMNSYHQTAEVFVWAVLLSVYLGRKSDMFV